MRLGCRVDPSTSGGAAESTSSMCVQPCEGGASMCVQLSAQYHRATVIEDSATPSSPLLYRPTFFLDQNTEM